MTNAYAYTTVPGKIPGLLAKIREVGIPQKANGEWLKTIGYRSSNDRSLLSVLKCIGFIDSTGAPSDLWRGYRGGEHQKLLGNGIRTGYQGLYATYPNAHEQSDETLANFFSAHTTAGKQVVDKTVATFKALAELADFSAPLSSTDTAHSEAVNADVGNGIPGAHTMVRSSMPNPSNGLVININVQLTLPESTNGQVYEQFFKAMRKSLIEVEQ